MDFVTLFYSDKFLNHTKRINENAQPEFDPFYDFSILN